MRTRERERLDREHEERERLEREKREREWAEVREAGGFVGVADQYPPAFCSYCGCAVLYRFAKKHRERCADER